MKTHTPGLLGFIQDCWEILSPQSARNKGRGGPGVPMGGRATPLPSDDDMDELIDWTARDYRPW